MITFANTSPPWSLASLDSNFASAVTLADPQSISGAKTFTSALTASTSVVTPLIGTDTATDLVLKANGVARWQVWQGGALLYPSVDATTDIGNGSFRVRTITVQNVDSGSTGALSLRANNGELIASFQRFGGVAANSWVFESGISASNRVQMYPVGGDSNITMSLYTRGNGSFEFFTNVAAQAKQVEIIHSASANRYITLTGSNGGNPILGVSGGSLHLRGSGGYSTIVQPTDAADGILQIRHGSQSVGMVFTSSSSTRTVGTEDGTNLSFATNGGSVGFGVRHIAGTLINYLSAQGAPSGNAPALGPINSSESNVGFSLYTRGTGSLTIGTNDNSNLQFSVTHTASANRFISVTGSNNGNPTLSTTAGNLAITPSVVIAGAWLQVGTTPATITAGLGTPYGASGGLYSRNQGNSDNIGLIWLDSINSVHNIVQVGGQGGFISSGVQFIARSGGSDPTTSDIPSGQWTLWKNTGAATTKIYYNDSGTIRSTQLGDTIVKRKTADESVTSSTTLQDDDHLTFAIAANEEWVVDFELDIGAALTTTGVKLAVNSPTGSTVNHSVITIADDNSTRQHRRTATIAGTLDFTSASFLAASHAQFKGMYWVLNGANAGNITLQFAQSTSSGTSVTIKKGSYMKAHRVA